LGAVSAGLDSVWFEAVLGLLLEQATVKASGARRTAIHKILRMRSSTEKGIVNGRTSMRLFSFIAAEPVFI
jgi:hypothetical protein